MISLSLIGGLFVGLCATLATAYAPGHEQNNTSSYCATHSGGSVGAASPIPLYEVPVIVKTPGGPQNPDDFVQIRNTNMLYPLAIDGKNFGSLSSVFAQNVVANLSQGPIVNGLPALEGALAGSLAKVTSHHNLGTQYIDVADNGCTAESITYFHASLFGTGSSYGQIVYALGQYQDSWVKQSIGWRIANRNLVFMGPFIGNVSIVS